MGTASPGRPGPPHVPPLRFGWLTRFYDRVLAGLFPEARLRGELIEQASLVEDHRVLDLGCGTGSLLLGIKARYPGIRAAGLDTDAEALRIARAKLEAAGLELDLRQGTAALPPFQSGSFDRIVSSLFFHHLDTRGKRLACMAAFDLLEPGGEIHVLDWGPPRGHVRRATFLLVQALDGFANTQDNVKGLLPLFLLEAGFCGVVETRRIPTVLGMLCLYRGVRAGA